MSGPLNYADEPGTSIAGGVGISEPALIILPAILGGQVDFAAGDALRRNGFEPPCATTNAVSSNCFWSARALLRQQCGDDQEIVREHGRSDQQFEALVTLGKAALHAAAAEQDRDAPLDAGAKALACLEGSILLAPAT